jgi:hypothetical protein
MESSTGKKNINTGVRMVPNPKPEKKVIMATKKAISETIIISIKDLVKSLGLAYLIFLHHSPSEV